MSNVAPRFSSRFTFLISAFGLAVGTGNIWRFPMIGMIPHHYTALPLLRICCIMITFMKKDTWDW